MNKRDESATTTKIQTIGFGVESIARTKGEPTISDIWQNAIEAHQFATEELNKGRTVLTYTRERVTTVDQEGTVIKQFERNVRLHIKRGSWPD